MKKITILSCLLFLATGAYAQKSSSPAERAEKEVADIATMVKLGEDQRERLMEVIVRREEKSQDMYEQIHELETKIADLNTMNEEEMKGIFTPEQVAMMARVKQDRENKALMCAKMGGHPACCSAGKVDSVEEEKTKEGEKPAPQRLKQSIR